MSIKPGEKPILGYYLLTPMPGDRCPEVSIGLYYVKDGTDGEFIVKLKQLSGSHGFSPQVCVFGDGMNVLRKPKVKKLLAAIEDHQFKDSKSFMDGLNKIGFKNMKELRK